MPGAAPGSAPVLTPTALLAQDAQRGRFSFGDAPSIADVYLVPQIESARRFKVDLSRWPLIGAVDKACAELDAFQRAAPTPPTRTPASKPPCAAGSRPRQGGSLFEIP